MELKQLHATLGNTMIYVTHDQVEAMTLATRIAIMKDGLIQQLAPPSEIYNRPVNKYVADFIGSPSMNFLEGEVQNGTFRCDGLSFEMTGYEFSRPGASGPASFGIRPEHILTGEAVESAPVRLDARVSVVDPLGADTLVLSKVAGAPFWIRMDGETGIRSGDTLSIGFDPARGSLFDAKDETRL